MAIVVTGPRHTEKPTSVSIRYIYVYERYYEISQLASTGNSRRHRPLAAELCWSRPLIIIIIVVDYFQFMEITIKTPRIERKFIVFTKSFKRCPRRAFRVDLRALEPVSDNSKLVWWRNRYRYGIANRNYNHIAGSRVPRRLLCCIVFVHL